MGFRVRIAKDVTFGRRRNSWFGWVAVTVIAIGALVSCGTSARPELVATEATTTTTGSITTTSAPATATTVAPVATPRTAAPAVTTTRPAPTTTTLLYGPCLDEHSTSAAACAKETLQRQGDWGYVARVSGTSTLSLTLTKGSDGVAEDVCAYTKIGFMSSPFENKVGVIVRSSAGALLRQSGPSDETFGGCYKVSSPPATTPTTTYVPPAYTPPPTSTSGGSNGGGSCTWVNSYYRKDGTHVSGYWRGC
jgi:hypothetical protein